MKSKTLIIGGSGFVGSNLINILRDFDVINYDKNDSPFFSKITIIGNVLDKVKLNDAMKGVDTVILLAAEHRDDVSPSSLYYDVNVNGTINVLNAMDNNEVKKIIFTSSVAIYGLNKPNPNEDYNQDPFNHYGKSKWQAEQEIYKWYIANPEKKIVDIIRPTVIFGERNRGNVYNFFKQIYSRKFLMIGSGKNKKSMAYVMNVVSFIKNRMMDYSNRFEIFNYVDKPDLDMNSLINLIKKTMGVHIINIKIPYFIGLIIGYLFDFFGFCVNKKLAISSIRIKKFCAETQFNSTKMYKVFNPPYSLNEGIIKTLEHEFLNPKDDKVLFYTE